LGCAARPANRSGQKETSFYQTRQASAGHFAGMSLEQNGGNACRRDKIRRAPAGPDKATIGVVDSVAGAFADVGSDLAFNGPEQGDERVPKGVHDGEKGNGDAGGDEDVLYGR
jgi:hypothetical protein